MDWARILAFVTGTDEELIDGLSFLAYRRIATLLHLPCTSNTGVSEVIVIDPLELETAETSRSQSRDLVSGDRMNSVTSASDAADGSSTGT